jgi:ABC-type arginine/histidine transport system permease subunit
MKKNIKLTVSKYLYKLLESNPFIINLFSEVIAHNIIDYTKIKQMNINILFNNNYIYYMITLMINDNALNSEIFYGKIQTNEINIVIS